MGYFNKCSIIWFQIFIMKKTILLSYFLLFSFFTFGQVININVIDDTPSCFGICCGSAEIIASGDNPPFFYQWSNGSNGTGIYNLTSGSYTVTVTDANGIAVQEIIEIGELGVDHQISEFSPQTCFGDEDVILKDSVLEGLSPFAFSIYDMDDNLISFFNSIEDSTHFYQNLAGGNTYRIVMSDERVCFSEKFFTTNEKPELLSSLGPDINLDLGQDYQIEAIFNQTITSINWTPTVGLSCDDCDNPIVTANENICYFLEATNIDGCMVRDTICIFTDGTPNENLTSEKFSFDISPNPVKNDLNIQTNFSGKWNFKIITHHGNVLLEKDQNLGLSKKIDVTNFPNGLYFLEVRNWENTLRKTIKFIKI